MLMYAQNHQIIYCVIIKIIEQIIKISCCKIPPFSNRNFETDNRKSEQLFRSAMLVCIYKK